MSLMNYTTDIPEGGKFTIVNEPEVAHLVKAKDAEILALKEQVASLQRVLAHHRDSDSEVAG